MKQQRDDNIRVDSGLNGDTGTLEAPSDFQDFKGIREWYMFRKIFWMLLIDMHSSSAYSQPPVAASLALLLSLASISSSSSDGKAIDVSGVETAWVSAWIFTYSTEFALGV